MKKEITIPIGTSFIRGDLTLVDGAQGLIIFAHGSGSSRLSKRNIMVARLLQEAHFSTFLFDLLTQEEEQVDTHTREFRFNIPLLAERLVLVTNWVDTHATAARLPIGYFGASTGAAAALIAAAKLPKRIGAVVSRGGRPDLAGTYLPKIEAPTLLIIGEMDAQVITLNQEAFEKLRCKKEFIVIPEATHLFEEKGALEQVAQHAIAWYETYL